MVVNMFKGIYSEVAKEAGKSSAILLNQLLQWKTVKVFRTNAEMFEDLDGVLSIATIQRCKQKLIDFGYVIVSFDKGLNRVTHYTLTEKALCLLTDKRIKQSVSKEQPVVKEQSIVPVVVLQRAEVSTKQDASAFYCLKESEPSKTSEPIEEQTKVAVNNTVATTESVTVEQKEKSGTHVDHEAISRFYEQAESDNNTSQKWTPKHLYAQHMKEKRILAQQNKEFFTPKSMRESFEKAGEIRREVVKGVPKELLSDPRLSKMLKSKQ